MLRRRSLISIGGKLPSQYQQVEYIQSTGTQYINLNVMLTNNIKVEAKHTISTIDACLFG